MCKEEKSFIKYVYSKARESESLDIYNRKKHFIKRNGRYLFSYPFTIFVLCTLLNGYSNDFLQLSASILSILIGLFITALVFALDKFYTPQKNNIGDYKLDVNENKTIRNLEISIDKIEFMDAKEKLWQKQSLYYVQNFNVLVGKNVIVGVFALALICLNVMYIDFFTINLFDYSFTSITLESLLLFMKLLFVIIVRFFICYYMIEVFYNTIRIISSMVNFMSVRIQK